MRRQFSRVISVVIAPSREPNHLAGRGAVNAENLVQKNVKLLTFVVVEGLEKLILNIVGKHL